MYWLKRIARKTLRLIRWSPAIYHWEPWDFSYTYELMEYVFNELQNYYSNPDNVHMLETRRLRIVNEVLIAKNLLKRLRQEEYYDPDYNSLKHPEWIHHPLPGKKGSKIEFKFDSEEHEKIYRKILRRNSDRSTQLRKQDLDYFGKMFKKTPGWWD